MLRDDDLYVHFLKSFSNVTPFINGPLMVVGIQYIQYDSMYAHTYTILSKKRYAPNTMSHYEIF